MLTQLEQHHRRLAECTATMRRLCAAASPDVPALCAARHALIIANVDRSKYIKNVIFPALDQRGDAVATIEALERDLSRKRAASSKHVTTWTTQAIMRDWAAYRVASARIARGVEERVQLERTMLVPLLRAHASR